jgi:hypothetical protein
LAALRRGLPRGGAFGEKSWPQAKRPQRLAWAYRRLADTIGFVGRLRILTCAEQAMQRYELLRKAKIRIGRFGPARSRQFGCLDDNTC